MTRTTKLPARRSRPTNATIRVKVAEIRSAVSRINQEAYNLPAWIVPRSG
jgi:hypothetical protein